MRRPLVLGVALFAGWAATGNAQSVGLTPQHAAIADVNNDGRSDLIVATTFDDTVSILLQDGVGAFNMHQQLKVGLNTSPVPDTDLPRFLLVHDVNHDRLPDITVLCSGSHPFGAVPSVQTLVNIGGGSFAKLAADATVSSFTSQQFPIHAAMGHFNGDHYPDLVVVHQAGSNLAILHGNGTGRYTPGPAISLAGESGQHVVVRDLDGDGRDDLLALTSVGLYAIRQTAAGTFGALAPFTLPVASSSLRAVAVGELEAGGALDAVIADADGRVQVLHGITVAGTSASAEVRNHTSLLGCSDIAITLWDGDLLPDMIVSNRTGFSVTVLRGNGTVTTLPTSSQPRRFALGDLNGDGRLDLVTANEGDQSVPSNPDYTMHFNPYSATNPWPVTAEGTMDLSDRAGIRMYGAVGVSAPEDERLWILSGNRRYLQNTRVDSSDRGRINFSFDIGGVVMRDDDGEGWLVERFAARIRQFDGSTIEGTINFAYDPGPLGFCGLAATSSGSEFWVSAPSMGTVLHINSAGTILQTSSVGTPVWDLSWNSNAGILYGANPGRSELRRLTNTGAPHGADPISLGSLAPAFRGNGVAGIAWESEDNDLYILSSAGGLYRTNTSLAVDESTSVSVGVRSLAVAYCSTENELLILGDDGHFALVELDMMDDEPDVEALLPAWQADPAFEPTGICYEVATERVYISDGKLPRVAEFSRSGNFFGFRDLSAEIAATFVPFRGLAVEQGTGELLLRTGERLVSADDGFARVVPPGPSGDMAISLGRVLTLGPHTSEGVMTPFTIEGVSRPAVLGPAAHVGGVVFHEEEHFYRLVERNGDLVLENFFLGNAMGSGSWASYE